VGSLYCSVGDLTTIGINPVSLQDVSLQDQNNAIVAASAMIDDRIAGRYQLPLLAWPSSFTYHCAKIAVYICLSARGYSPDAGADPLWKQDYEKAIEWANGIQRQAIHPQVTPSSPSPGNATYDLPQVQTSVSRGWNDFGPGIPRVG
jgi:phage gp36-like protein